MEPARKSLKRKHYEVMKNDLGVELTKLTNDSRDLHNDMRSATEDFELMCKSTSDRQADFLTRSLFLEEKYGEVIGILDGDAKAEVGESSGENVVLPSAYAAAFQRFVTDSNVTLKDHCALMEEEHASMMKVFGKYEDIWNQNLKDLREKVAVIAQQRVKLSSKLRAFNGLEVDDSDSS